MKSIVSTLRNLHLELKDRRNAAKHFARQPNAFACVPPSAVSDTNKLHYIHVFFLSLEGKYGGTRIQNMRYVVYKFRDVNLAKIYVNIHRLISRNQLYGQRK